MQGAAVFGAGSYVYVANAGLLGGAGVKTFHGMLDLDYESYLYDGSFTVASDGRLWIRNSAGGGGSHYIYRPLNINSDGVGDHTAEWTAGQVHLIGGTITNNGVFNAAASGTFDLNLYAYNGGDAQNPLVNAFINNGVFNKRTGSQTLYVRRANAGNPNSRMPFTNNGTLNVDAGTLRFDEPGTNSGVIDVQGTATLLINGAFPFSGSSVLRMAPGASARVANLLGSTTNADQWRPRGTLTASGSIEVMARDVGPTPAGFNDNFAYTTLYVLGGSILQLVDQDDNSQGSEPEALYAQQVVVPAGSTLNLNGKHLYARATQINGTVNGTITLVDDSGSIPYGAPTPGQISSVGEIDEWTVFAHAGRGLTVLVNPGGPNPPTPLPPPMQWAQVDIVDPNGNVVASASNIAGGAGSLASILGLQVSISGTYRIRIHAPAEQSAATGRYMLTVHNVSVDTRSLAVNQTYVGDIEAPESIDRWVFTAATNQQVRFELANRESASIVFTLEGPGGFVAFSDFGQTSELINLPATGTYVLSARGLNGGTGHYAFRLSETTVVELDPGDVYSGIIAGPGHAQLFRINTTEPKPLYVALDDLSNGDRNELYIRFGAPPTRGTYDYRFSATESADQGILIPNAYVGPWYALVYTNFAPIPSLFTLRGVSSDVILQAVTPDQYGANSDAVLTLLGGGFVPGMQVALVDAAQQEYLAKTVEIDSFSRITATFNLAGMAQGTYSVRARHPGGDFDTLPFAFRVTPAGQAHLETRLIMPGALGYHGVATIYVEYANTGTAAMPAPLLRLQSADPQGNEPPILTLNPTRMSDGFWTSGMPDGFSDSIQILAHGTTPGVLNPGERIQVPVYYAGLLQPWDFSDRSIEMEIRIFDGSNTDPIPWDDLRAELRPPTISEPAWNAVYPNITANVGTDWGDFIQMLSENAVYLGRLGQNIADVSELWSFELQQAIGFTPIGTLASSIDASVPTPGLSLSFGRTWTNSITARQATGIFGRGWGVPWQTTLFRDEDGTVTIFGVGDGYRRFQPDTRSGGASFLPPPGESGQLRRVSANPDVYELREPNGLMTRFLPVAPGPNVSARVHYTQDPNGNRLTAAYAGELITNLTHSSGQFLLLSYNGAGLVQTITDSAGRATTFTYDATNQYLLTVTDHGGQVTRYTYQTSTGPGQHALTSVETGGTTRTFTYDERGRLGSTFLTGGASRITLGYDNLGRVTATDAANGTRTFFYDHRGLLAKVVDPLGFATSAEYDANRRISRLIDPLGQAQTFTWCSCGSMTSITDQLGHTTRFSYNGPFRRMSSFTDARGNTTRYTYDDRGNLTSTIYPNDSVERINGYDPFGNPLSYVNRRGQAIGYQYNVAGQVTRQSFPDGTHNEFHYDTHGNLVRTFETDTGRETLFAYDAADRLTRVTYPEGRYLDYTYDAFGRRIRMMDHEGFAVNYSYDAAGRLHRLTDAEGSLFVAYTYDSAGRLARKDNGNGTYTVHSFDVAGRLLRVTNYHPGGDAISAFVYEYDEVGRRTGAQTPDGVWTYGYDATGQLLSAVFVSANPEIANQGLFYQYDPVGNRVRTVENDVETLYESNVLNQITRLVRAGLDDEVFTYDADGNLLSQEGSGDNIAFAYDPSSRVVQTMTSSGTWQYEYDALGNRRAATTDGRQYEYVIDVLGIRNIVTAHEGGAATHFVYGRGLVLQVGADANLEYYDFDGGGSVADTTSASGEVVQRYAYEPFGRVMWQATPRNGLFTFGGRAGVASYGEGTYQTRFRFYMPDIGRFVTIDPIRLRGADQNLYRYARNAPTNRGDPLGLKSSFSGAVDDYRDAVDDLTNTDEVTQDQIDAISEAGEAIDPAGDEFINDIGGAWPILPPSFDWTDWGWWGDWFDIFDDLTDPLQDPDAPETVPDNPQPQPQPHPTPTPTPPTPNGFPVPGPLVRGEDPNALYAPSGYGPQNYLRGDFAFPYRIEFENYGPGSLNEDGTPADPERWATAPAQRIEVTNTLSSSLDWGTFRLTSFGFGDFLITVPNESQHFQTVINMTYNGVAFEVHVEAGIDLVTGTIFAAFQSIDPALGLPPPVLYGFLPPEDGTGRGKGFLTYTIRPNAGLPTGTEIRNIALISFDGQTFIATNQVDPLHPELGIDPDKEALVTIDAGAPDARVLPLPERVSTRSFLVRWIGEDDAPPGPLGSGVATYTVYVSIDGGDYSPWYVDTTLTEATYDGLWGRTYSFFALARDHTGQEEILPPAPSAEATTITGLEGVTYFDNDAADGDWHNPLNWVGDSLPIDGAIVVIDIPGLPTVFYTGGSLQLAGLSATSEIIMSTGTLSVKGIATFAGGLNITGGTLNLFADAVATGQVRNAGTLSLSVATTFSITGNYLQTAAGTLHTDVQSAIPGGFGRIIVTGSASLDGRLTVAFVGGYDQTRGDAFQIISATNSSGTFTTLDLPPEQDDVKPIILYNPAGGPGGVRLFITSRADFNNDGNVNSQDFFDFLIGFFNNSSDFNGDGVVNSQDFFDFLTLFFQG